jgi:hypothetical protein
MQACVIIVTIPAMVPDCPNQLSALALYRPVLESVCALIETRNGETLVRQPE